MGWFSSFTGGLSDLLSGAGEAVLDLGSSIDDTVNSSIPGGWATVISVANPALAPVAVGAQTIAKGGDLEDALKSAALTYGLQTVGNQIVSTNSNAVTPEMIAQANATSDPVASLASQAGWVNVDPTYIAEISTPSVTVDSFKPDYSFSSPTKIEGLKPFSIPSLESMGGGQGLVSPVEGGFMTSRGFIPMDAIMDIGSPNSFINNGQVNVSALQDRVNEVVQKKLMQEALASLVGVGAAVANQPAPSSSIPAYQQPNNMPMYDQAYFDAVQKNYNELAPQGLMADVATPLKEWYTPETSIVKRLFG